MEPVTHVLTGACLARAGFNRRAAYATLAMAIAAELPDIDVLWGLRGPVAGFQHHRGITHTFLGLPVEAALVVLVLYILHRWRVIRANGRDTSPLTKAPVRWGALYGFCLLALLSHLLLDYTNNYGLRPFFPFDPHWYAASLVFIFDPYIFALLVLGLVMPSLFRLISSEVGGRRQPFSARGWPAAALVLIVMLWSVRWVEHDRALRLALSQSLAAPASQTPDNPAATSASEDNTAARGSSPAAEAEPLPTYLAARRALASPDPFSIFRWYTVTDFGPLYQLERVDTLQQTIVATEGTYTKGNAGPATVAAESSPLGRAFIDWSPMPILSTDNSIAALEEATAGTNIEPPAGGTVVTLRDPRFMGMLPWMTGNRTPLTATVVLDRQSHVVAQALDGHAQPTR